MKTYLISKTETIAQVFEVKALGEDEAIYKLKMNGSDNYKRVSVFTTDVFYQSEGEV